MLAFQQPVHPQHSLGVFSSTLCILGGSEGSNTVVDENTLGEILHNCSQPLAALSNQQGIFKSLWSEHIPPTPESELQGPSLNSF